MFFREAREVCSGFNLIFQCLTLFLRFHQDVSCRRSRKLLVELWHFVEHGVVPEGAVLKDERGAASTRVESAA